MNKKTLLIISIFLITGVVLLSRDSYASDIIEENNTNNIDLVLEDNDNIDALESNIVLLNDSYVLIEDKVKMIDEFKIKNDTINKDIDKKKK